MKTEKIIMDKLKHYSDRELTQIVFGSDESKGYIRGVMKTLEWVLQDMTNLEKEMNK